MNESLDRAAVELAASATTIPLFSCAAVDVTLAHYGGLGFEVTHEQMTPYQYGAVRWGGVELHFHGGKGVDPKQAAACLVLIDDVTPPYHAFVDRLRHTHRGLPVAGLPRITRLRPGQTRFTLYDPDGNTVTFIAKDEPEYDYEANTTEDEESGFGRTLSGISEGQSPLMQALEIAVFLRDTYHKDRGAAKKLDTALARATAPLPIEYARALAARAELALALGEAEHAQTLRDELAELSLSDEDLRRYADELRAPDQLEEWLRPPR